MPKERTPRLTDIARKTIYDDLFPKTLSKSDKRRLEIIEGAIKAYSSVNFNHVSFDDVAIPAKTSRRLVQHYFPDKNELFETSMKLIRAQFQILAVEALAKTQTPEEQFKEYILSTFYWVKQQPQHVRAWFLFFLVCSQKPKLRKMHQELTQMGEDRIKALITALNLKKPPNESDLHYIAKTIQRLITGGIIEICSELSPGDIARVQTEVLSACLSIVSGRRNIP